MHSTTARAPAELVFGRKLRTRLDIINPFAPSPSNTSLAKYVINKQCLQSKTYSGKNKKQFNVEDKVLYKKNFNNNQFTWCKGTIIKRKGRVVYLVKDNDTCIVFKKHKNQLIPYKGRQECASFENLQLSDLYSLPRADSVTNNDDIQSKGEEDQQKLEQSSPDTEPATSSTPPSTRPQEELLDVQSEETPEERPSDSPTRNRRYKRNRPLVNYKQYF